MFYSAIPVKVMRWDASSRNLETFSDGLRSSLEAPSTSWSEWMPTGITQTLPVSAMRWDETNTLIHEMKMNSRMKRHLLMRTSSLVCYLGLWWATHSLPGLSTTLTIGGFCEIDLLANVRRKEWGIFVWLWLMSCVLALYAECLTFQEWLAGLG